MNISTLKNKTKRAALLLLLTLLSASVARAQDTIYTELPYECGFENGMESWSTVGINWGRTGITTNYHHDGGRSFCFHEFDSGEHDPQYLISPPFTCTEALVVSFYHYKFSGTISKFQIGFSTTSNDPTTFTWIEEITPSLYIWVFYEHTFPVGTRYVAIRFDYVDSEYGHIIALDDFAFREYSPYPMPTSLSVSNVTDQSATLTWTAPETNLTVTGYAYQYKTDAAWSTMTNINGTSVTLSGLSLNTTYDFRVKALYAGDHASNYVSTRFMTEGLMESIPHYQGFENGMGGWRILDGYNTLTNITPDASHSGSHAFYFNYQSEIPQYLISPQLNSSKAITVSFYYANPTLNNTSYIARFKVGYSTTNKDLGSFIWSDEIYSSKQWRQYTDDLPAETKYIAVQWIDGYSLYLDDFSIEHICPDITVDPDHPFSENFLSQTSIPHCWENPSVMVDGVSCQWKWDQFFYHNDGGSAFAGKKGHIYLMLPDIHLPALANTAQLSFWSLYTGTLETGYGFYAKCSVVLIDGDNEIELWDAGNDRLEQDWLRSVVDLSAYLGQTIKLAFKHEGRNTTTWSIDNVGIAVTLSGEGTEQNPYLITTTMQLEALANMVNIGNSFEGKFFSLAADLNYDSNTPNNHTPIGNGSSPFKGTFNGYYDGTYHTISGLRIISNNSQQGLFGVINDGTVKNLTLTDAQISGSEKVGGIVGWNDGGTLTGCTVFSSTISSGGGAIVGTNQNGTLQRNYYLGCTVGEVTDATNVGTSSGDANGARLALPVNLPASLSLASASANGIILDGQLYGGATESLTLDESTPDSCLYTVNHGTITQTGTGTYTLTIAANATTAVTVSIFMPDYTIHTASDWDIFCDALQDNDTFDRFIGKTVKLDADITVTRMAGSSTHDFMGTFDGQGHTLTITYGTADTPLTEAYAAPFRYVENGAVIHSLHVDGHIYTSNQYASGIVGCQYGTVSVSNCRSSVIIHSSINGNGTHGGIVAVQHGGTLTMSGCVYDGRMLTTNGTTLCGGLVGWRYGTCTLSDCLYAPTEVTLAPGETYINDGATLCRNYSGTPANCYYTERMGGAQGKQAHSITSGEGVLLEMAGEATEYNISGITGYGTGIMYESVLYAGKQDEVNLNLTLPEGFSVVAVTYTPEGGTTMEIIPVNGVYSFTMPDADVVIDAMTNPSLWPGQGTEQVPYIITTIGQLETLARLVNSGANSNGFNGTYFRLDADLAYDTLTQNNHTPIGTYVRPFSGTFDGNNHTISGIRISNNNNCQGVFGCCQNGIVKNLILTDTQIRSKEEIGGIVGYCSGGSSVENCHVANNVILCGSGGDIVGGIVGYNYGSSIADCQVANNITIRGDRYEVGGIAGYNYGSSIANCQVANNVAISGNKEVGGIAGYNYGSSIANCQVANNVTLSGSGDNVGGIAGYNYGSSIADCQVANNVTISGDDQVSGVAGNSYGGSSVENCHVANNVTVSGDEQVGGIVGYNSGSIEDCQVANNVTISGNTTFGTIVGYYYQNPLHRNYYLGCTVNDVANATNVGSYFGDVTENDGAVPGYLLTLGEHITSNAISFTTPAYGEMPETTYHVAPSGDTITLGYELAGCEVIYYVNGEAIEGNTFTMPAEDVNVTATWADYTIHTASDWDNFCDALQDNATYNRFIGKTVKLGADISVTRMAGSSTHDFMGTFDGQGHTLTITYGSAENPITEEYAAPFRNVENGCVIENLHVVGTITTGNKFAAGIVAQQYGAVTIRNCRSSVTIQSSVEGDGTHGGLVGVKGNSNNANLTIEGCTFDGKIVSTGITATTLCGGFVGWRSNSGSLTITNSLYAPTADDNAVSSGATFARNWTMSDDANCYYTETMGAAQGKLAIANPAVSPIGEATATYDVSDLTFYSNGVQFGEVFYYDPEAVATQTIALSAGVNWVSFNVETTLDDLKAALVATGGTNIVIKAKNSSTTWNGHRWLGSLNGFNVNQMYKVTVQAGCEITLQGMPMAPGAHPITISNGTNWIGYPLNESMTLTEAFAGFPANQDVVKSKTASATWNGHRWVGQLNTLQPGQGYIYKSKAAGDKTFTFPTDNK